MQLDREYLFIEEVESHFGFTIFDLIDYLNQDRLNLYAWVSLKSIYGVCTLSDNDKESIIGSFDYKGIIQVTNEMTPLVSGKIESANNSDFKLLQQELIQNWRDQKPHTLSYPNKDFLEYRFLANFNEYEVKPLIDALDSFERQRDTFEKTNNPENYTQQDFSNDEYTKHSLTIEPSDLRVKRSEIENIVSKNKRLSKKSNLPDALIEKQTSPIDDL